MTDVVRVRVNGTDHGPAGTGLVTGLTCAPGGLLTIGQGSLEFKAVGGGGYTLLPMMAVEVDRWNGTQITGEYFKGYLGRYTGSRLLGSSLKVWTFDVFDSNLLRKRLVSRLGSAARINVPAGHFDTQIIYILAQLAIGATKGIAYDQVANLTGSTTLPAIPGLGGLTLEKMIQRVFANAVANTPTLRPALALGPDYVTLPRLPGVSDNVMAYVWDSALTSPAIAMDFSDAPSGGQQSLLAYNRVLDPADLVSGRQSILQASGYTATTIHSGSVATYPNDYGYNGAWWDEPLSDTVSQTSAAADALLAATVAGTAYPRETLTITTDAEPPPLPGQFVTITLALEGLTTALYQVAGAAGIEFLTRHDGTYIVRSQLALGLPQLELGQVGGQTGGAPVVAVPPDVPGTPTASSNAFDPLVGNTAITYAWAAPSNPANVAGYRVTVTTGGIAYTHAVSGAGVLTYADRVNPGAVLSVTVASYGTNGLYSVESAALSVTAAAAYAPDPPTALTLLRSGPEANGKGWAVIGFTPPGTTHGPHDQYQVRVVGGGRTWDPLWYPGTNTEVEVSGLTLGVTYTIDIRTLSNPTWYGAYSSTLSVTVPVNQGPPVTVGGGGQAAVDQPLWPFSQTAGTGTVTVSSTDPYEGGAVYAFVSTGADTQTLTGLAWGTAPGQAWGVRTAAKKSAGSPTFAGSVQWDDGSGTWALTASTLTLPALTTGWPAGYTENQVIAPTGAVLGRLVYTATFAAALTIRASLPAPARAAGAADVASGAITNAKLGTITDPTKFAWDIETNPLALYDAAGNYRGRISYDAANNNIKYQGDNPSANSGQVLGTTAINLLVKDESGFTFTGAGIRRRERAIPASGGPQSFTLDYTDHVLLVDATGGLVTLTLPAASDGRQEYWIKKIDSSANVVRVTRAGSDTLEGAVKIDLTTQYASTRIISDKVNLWTVW